MLYLSVLHHGAVEGVIGLHHQIALDADTRLFMDGGAFHGVAADRRATLVRSRRSTGQLFQSPSTRRWPADSPIRTSISTICGMQGH